MYRLKEYPAHDNSNRGNDYRGIVMTIHHMEDNTNHGNDYRGNIIMATHHKEDIGNNSTLCIYNMKFKFYPWSPYKEKDYQFHYNRWTEQDNDIHVIMICTESFHSNNCMLVLA